VPVGKPGGVLVDAQPIYLPLAGSATTTAPALLPRPGELSRDRR